MLSLLDQQNLIDLIEILYPNGLRKRKPFVFEE
jgi:hypothetical protein